MGTARRSGARQVAEAPPLRMHLTDEEIHEFWRPLTSTYHGPGEAKPPIDKSPPQPLVMIIDGKSVTLAVVSSQIFANMTEAERDAVAAIVNEASRRTVP